MPPNLDTNLVAAAVVNGKVVPGTEDIVHERFLACVEKGDTNAAMAHFAFISCDARERGAQEQALREELVALRRRQLLELLCEKGMVNEASELLANAVASPGFNSRDSSTIVSDRERGGGGRERERGTHRKIET